MRKILSVEVPAKDGGKPWLVYVTAHAVERYIQRGNPPFRTSDVLRPHIARRAVAAIERGIQEPSDRGDGSHWAKYEYESWAVIVVGRRVRVFTFLQHRAASTAA